MINKRKHKKKSNSVSTDGPDEISVRCENVVLRGVFLFKPERVTFLEMFGKMDNLKL